MSTVTAVPIVPVKRGYIIWLISGLLMAILVAGAVAVAGSSGYVTTPSGLRYKIIAEGAGVHPTGTDVALINYVGRLADGKVFDESRQPTPLPVSGSIPGFAEALKLMRKGARFQIMVPPELGYGARAQGPIPANATLMFDIELVDFMPEAVVRQMQMQQQMMQRGAPGR